MADNKLAVQIKVCPKCKVEKPVTMFWRQAASRDGLQNRCKTCFYEWRREADKRYMDSGQHASRQREGHYRRNYGLSLAEVDAMARDQKNRCLLCGRGPGKRSLHLDHDHSTGRIRGLLCYGCNRAIGHFRDDPDLMLRAALYVMGGENDAR
jgi:hypothetical protein